ncbi:MAG: hypothetical protein AAF901_02955 [Bacteroidota bacterium]
MSTKRQRRGPVRVGTPRSNKEKVVDSFSMKLTGADFRIDHRARRKNQSTHRRALVHDFTDGLTINWAKDYPGGVTINGNVNCPDKLVIKNKDVLRLITSLQKKVSNLERLYDMIDWDASQ